jgi:hypothetical protein
MVFIDLSHFSTVDFNCATTSSITGIGVVEVYILHVAFMDLQTDKMNSTLSGHSFIFGQSSAKSHYCTNRVDQFNP